MVGRVLCIANQKGGVGKTTTAINLADALAKSGASTLLVDLDPQCNATSGSGIQPSQTHPFLSDRPLRELAVSVETPGLSLLPGSRRFADIEELVHSDDRLVEIPKRLSAIQALFDFVLIDCPPSLGSLTRAALHASTEVVMPIQCEYFAMEGLTQMIEVIRDVMQEKPERLEFGGILLTMFDRTLELSYEVEEEVRDFFGEIVFETTVPRDVSVAEAPSHSQSVLDYSPRSRGTRAYIELCMEVLERDG